jgi:hypothetical protein
VCGLPAKRPWLLRPLFDFPACISTEPVRINAFWASVLLRIVFRRSLIQINCGLHVQNATGSGRVGRVYALAGKQIESMKVFIRNTKTGWYYQVPSHWTPDQQAACDLEQVARAVEKIFEDRLENVEILLSYDEPRYDLILSVPPFPSRAEPLRQRPPVSKEAPNKKASR